MRINLMYYAEEGEGVVKGKDKMNLNGQKPKNKEHWEQQ